jgi:hypothetical protein
MAPQHQVAARRSQDIIMNKDDSKIQGFKGKSVYVSKYSDNHHFQADGPAVYENNFNGSDFVDGDEPARPYNNYEDFILFEDDPPFIDEDASMIANHGSVYNGMNNERAACIEKYTSFNYNDEEQQPVTSFREAVAGAIEQGVSEAVEGQRPPPQDQPLLFSNFEATTGPSMLSQWATTDHRHEIIAYRYGQPPYPSDRLPSPAKRRRTKSAKGRRRR